VFRVRYRHYVKADFHYVCSDAPSQARQVGPPDGRSCFLVDIIVLPAENKSDTMLHATATPSLSRLHCRPTVLVFTHSKCVTAGEYTDAVVLQ